MTNFWLFLVGLLSVTEVMAWTNGRVSGDVEMSGTIQLESPSNPWEVLMGEGLSTVNISVPKGQATASIVLQENTPLLGIRTRGDNTTTFSGAKGITPQISYRDLINSSKYPPGRLPFAVKVTNSSGDIEIGTLNFSLRAGAEVSSFSPAPELSNGLRFSAFATKVGDAFYGGIARSRTEADPNVRTMIGARFPNYILNFNPQGLILAKTARSISFNNPERTYSAYYGAGLGKGDVVTLKFNDNYKLTDEDSWRARISVTVTYV